MPGSEFKRMKDFQTSYSSRAYACKENVSPELTSGGLEYKEKRLEALLFVTFFFFSRSLRDA